MAHEADFFGENLRLSSFLRIVEKMPRRPARFQQDLERNMRNTMNQEVLAAHRDSPAPKKVKVYTAKANISATSNQRILSIRPKKRLPVGGLALIRVSTKDGIPLPGDAELTFDFPITDTDPIEECQANTLRERTQTPQNHVNSQDNRILRNGDPNRKVLSSSNRIKKTKTLKDRNIDPRGRDNAGLNYPQKKPRCSDPESLCDGFVGLELLLPQSKSQKRSAEKQNGHRPKMLLPTSSGQLPLAEGSLPQPLNPDIRMTKELHFSDPLHLELTHDSAEKKQKYLPSLKVVVQLSNTPSVKDDACNGANDSLLHQFSSITAPARDTSDSEAEEDSDDLGGEDNYGDLEAATETSHSDVNEFAASDAFEETMSYFGEASYYPNGLGEGF